MEINQPKFFAQNYKTQTSYEEARVIYKDVSVVISIR